MLENSALRKFIHHTVREELLGCYQKEYIISQPGGLKRSVQPIPSGPGRGVHTMAPPFDEPEEEMEEATPYGIQNLKELFGELEKDTFNTENIKNAIQYTEEMKESIVTNEHEMLKTYDKTTLKRNVKSLNNLVNELNKLLDEISNIKRRSMGIVDEIGYLSYRFKKD